MAWIRSMSSTRNRPRAPLRLDLWCQRRVNRSRCQRRRVSGLTTWRASRHAVFSRARNTRISRSSAWRRGRDGAAPSEYEGSAGGGARSRRQAPRRGRTASMLTAHTSAAPVRDGPQHVRDGPATFVDASTDGRLDGPGQPVQHAGLLSHRVLGSRGRGTRFSQQRLTALRRKPLLCGWTGQVASTGFPSNGSVLPWPHDEH